MSDEQGIVWSEKLELLQWRPILRLQSRRGHHKCHVVAWVRGHDLVGTHRPVNPLDLVPRVLDHHRRRLRRLTVPHDLFLSSKLRLKLLIKLLQTQQYIIFNTQNCLLFSSLKEKNTFCFGASVETRTVKTDVIFMVSFVY